MPLLDRCPILAFPAASAQLRVKAALLCCLAIGGFAADAFGAKKDYKGLFGSYRREKFTENEGRSTDFGIDIMLSTLLPVSSVVKSSESGGAAAPMYYAMFFNAEASFFFTLNYSWEIYLNIGYYSYSTRKQNNTTVTNPGSGTFAATTPQFQLFDMDAIPVTLGAKYRLTRTDIVPYIGLGAGAAYVHRRTSYDYGNPTNDNYSMVLAAQVSVGLEFYISARTGIRLETSAMYMGLSSMSFAPGGSFPTILYQPNPIAVRYASGLFILF